MTYTLAPFVTAEMLEKEGFEPTRDNDIAYIKRTNDFNVFIERKTQLVYAWDVSHIQDLISKGYVIVNG